MAKRFIDTNLFRSGFIKSLSPEFKLFWVYIINDCDHSGIWETDFEVAELRLGIKLDLEKLKKSLTNKIVVLDGGQKWFIPAFIEFQYGKLSLQNRVHNSVISNLKKFNLINEDLTIKPLTSPLQRAKDKDKDKDMDMDKDKDEDKDVGTETLDCEVYPTFDDFWNLYDRKEDKKDAIKKWEKLNQLEKEYIMSFIPNYKLSLSDLKYQRNPVTFLNKRTWENELPKTTPQNGQSKPSNKPATVEQIIDHFSKQPIVSVKFGDYQHLIKKEDTGDTEQQ